jgi:uncharacterized surface protein with fasciclin (FAS1) repeats
MKIETTYLGGTSKMNAESNRLMKRVPLMRQSRSVAILLAALPLLLAACGGTSAQDTPTAVPTLVPTSEPTGAATSTISTASTTSTPAPTADVSTTTASLNDATQARLRVSQCVYGEPDMDVYLNGKIPLDAGIPLSNVGAGNVTRYEYLEPGTVSVALVPTGESSESTITNTASAQPFFGPLDVPVIAGHRYTVVVLGQQDAKSHKALVIDETAAYQAIGAKPTDAAHITVNNLKGVDGIDFALGLVSGGSAPYGGFKAATYPVGPFKDLTVTFSGSADKHVDHNDVDSYEGPGTDALDCFGGTYPGTAGTDYDTHTSSNTSSLTALDYLQTWTDAAATKNSGKPSTNKTFLEAVKKAGLTDMLAHGEPYIVFAPTDEAFAAMPKDKLDALIADPKAVSDLVRRHIVEGYYPPLTLVTGRYMGGYDRTVTNLLGEKLALTGSDDLVVNGQDIGSQDSVMVANGTRLYPWITKVLPPPTK